ncbi:lipopolysaccharide biosynthesis protein [Paenibacillus sp. HJGM_3]|uniref:lipopolysaccharide biosynthesis protein n=1 Tax=Paenibacillus sp. HJGM_3 TaxID=3379816 RepID=UPI003859A607
MKTNIALFNIISNLFGKLITAVLGILIPKLIIDYYGSEINGLVTSLIGIFVYVNLLEAGVGGASVQALYSAIAKKNKTKINGILAATSKFYKKTSIVYLVCVTTIALLYPVLVKTGINYWLVVAIVLTIALTSFIEYYFKGIYNVLLLADNKSYILVVSSTILSVLSSIIKVLLIIFEFSIVFVLFSVLILTTLRILFIVSYVKKNYKFLDLSVTPDFSAISKKSAVLIQQVLSVIINNVDILILTIFCNLKLVSLYTVYNIICIQVLFIPKMFSESLTAGFGHLFVEDKLRFKMLFDSFEALYTYLMFTVMIIAYILMLPFIKLYTADITDINYVDPWLPLLFVSIRLLESLREPSLIVASIAGHFNQLKWYAIFEAILNISLSILLVRKYGIYGVLIATIIAMLFYTIAVIRYSNKYLLRRSWIIPVRRWFINLILGSVIVYLANCFKYTITSYFDFGVVFVVFLICIGGGYLSLFSIVEAKALKVVMGYISIFFHKIRKKLLI